MFDPGFDGALFSREWKDALWDKFFTAAPQRQRRSVEQYKIVKRAKAHFKHSKPRISFKGSVLLLGSAHRVLDVAWAEASLSAPLPRLPRFCSRRLALWHVLQSTGLKGIARRSRRLEDTGRGANDPRPIFPFRPLHILRDFEARQVSLCHH